jgi:hypothetical protein
MTMPNDHAIRVSSHLTVCALIVSVAGCEVVNPGPVADEYMTLPSSQAGFVNGSIERLNRGLGYEVYTSALHAREIFPSGQTGSYGFAAAEQAGSLGWGASGQYNNGQQARWIAEEALRKFEERGDVTPAIMTQAYLAAGYANRFNGDFYCYSVIDGGPLLPGSHYWERAEGHFTKAIAIAPSEDLKRAALAGRAQVRVSLGNWAGAAADAAQVPNSFVYWLPMDFAKGGDTNQRNHVQYANGDNPYRTWTVNFTNFHAYYTQTGDPRTPWREFERPEARNCTGALQGFAGGSVPCTQQQKYKTENDDTRLASGAEMRLIEAEAALVRGDWQAAMTIINALRRTYVSATARQPLQPWTANNLTEAWTVLKRERGIELWLEGRRIPDMRRWEPVIGQPARPGDLEFPNFEARSVLFTSYQRGRPVVNGEVEPRVLCYNISQQERTTNLNFKDDPDNIETP